MLWALRSAATNMLIGQIRLWSWFLAGLLVSAAHAASPPSERTIDEVAFETAECAAYFAICSVAMENQPDLAEGFKRYADDALKKALIATKEAGLDEETVSVHYEMALKNMSDRIGNDTSNMSMLMVDYDERCIDAMTDVNKRIKSWRQKRSKP